MSDRQGRWRLLLAVGLGGVAGGLARVVIGASVGTVLPGWVVLALVNVLGSFAIGVAVGRGGRWAHRSVTTGVLGGFTTFSGWALDVVGFAGSAPLLAMLLLLAVPVACLGACVGGLALAGR